MYYESIVTTKIVTMQMGGKCMQDAGEYFIYRIVLNCRSYFELVRPGIAEITISGESLIRKGAQS